MFIPKLVDLLPNSSYFWVQFHLVVADEEFAALFGAALRTGVHRTVLCRHGLNAELLKIRQTSL